MPKVRIDTSDRDDRRSGSRGGSLLQIDTELLGVLSGSVDPLGARPRIERWLNCWSDAPDR